MKKSNIIIISILSVVIICLIGGLFYLNEYYKKQLDYIFYTNVDETKGREYDCSFTKTYRVVLRVINNKIYVMTNVPWKSPTNS